MKMKAVVRYGAADGEVEVRDVPVPEIGDGDVLLRVRAAGLCGSDLNAFRGRGGRAVAEPYVMGHEFAGEIAAVGKRVAAWKPGDRAVSDNTGYVCGVCHACITGEYLQCPNRKGLGSKLDGGFAEYVKISEQVLLAYPNCLMRIPDGISYEEAAILDPAANGYNALIQQAGMIPGDSVAVCGAGPLGLGCIAAASIGGAAHIIVIVRKSTNELHRGMAKTMGATHIVEQEDALAAVMKITDGEGTAVTCDSAGANSLFPLTVDITRNGGHISRIGYDFAPLSYNFNDFTNRNLTLHGHMGYNPTSWKQVIKLVTLGKWNLRQTITKTLPLTEFSEGIRLMESREVIKLVFHP